MTFVRKAHPLALAALGYVLITLTYTWPLPRHILHGVPHDAGDPLLTAWMMWWTTKALPLTAAWWNAPMFFPAEGTFAFSEHLLGLAPLTAPIIWLTGNPLFAQNVMLLASYVLCGLGAHFLAYTLTGRHDAAFVAGVAYAFAPYRLAQLPHIHVLSSYWAPVCLAALHRYDRVATADLPRRSFSGGGWAVLAAAAWLMQALSNGYYLFFLSVLVALWFLWFVPRRWTFPQIARIGACFAVAAAILSPILVHYQRVLIGTYGFGRGIGEVRVFSADVGSLLNASDESLLWGWLHAIRKPEAQLFPGVAIAALVLFAVLAARPFARSVDLTRRGMLPRRLLGALVLLLVAATMVPIVFGAWQLTIGGVRVLSIARADKPGTLAAIALVCWVSTLPAVAAAIRRRSILVFYAAAGLVMWLCALGPDPEFFASRALYQAPYGWLIRLPGFDGLRVPARFWMLALVCLSALAALAIARLQDSRRRTVVCVAVLALMLDGWPRTYIVIAAPEHRPTPPGAALRVDLPMDPDHDALALYQQTFDAVPLANGFSGYPAPHQYAMQTMLNGYDERILQALAAYGPLAVIIDHAADPQGDCRRFVRTYRGAVLYETHPGWSSYQLPRSAGGVAVPDMAGRPLDIKALTASRYAADTPRTLDGNRRTGWSAGMQQPGTTFTIELGAAGHVGQVVTDLGEFYTGFPVTLQIEVSEDGIRWDTAFSGSTALQAYYGALRHPRQIPLVFPIGRDGVRFIRLQQRGSSERDWTIAEVHVLN